MGLSFSSESDSSTTFVANGQIVSSLCGSSFVPLQRMGSATATVVSPTVDGRFAADKYVNLLSGKFLVSIKGEE